MESLERRDEAGGLARKLQQSSGKRWRNLNKAESVGWGTGDGFETVLGENRDETLVVKKRVRHQG